MEGKMDLKTKKKTIYVIGQIYFISAWCLTIGYFTPKWIYTTEQNDYEYMYTQDTPCYIGLIYTWCGHNSAVMNNALIMMSVGLVIKYLTVVLIGLGIYFDLWKYTMFMTMLSILFGTFYPAAAILILVSTTYVEVYFLYRENTVGYSVILCTVAGVLMLIVFVCLVLYNQMSFGNPRPTTSSVGVIRVTKWYGNTRELTRMYQMYVRERTQTSKKQMNASTLKLNVNTTTDSTHHGRSDSKQFLNQYKHKSVGPNITKKREDDGGFRSLKFKTVLSVIQSSVVYSRSCYPRTVGPRLFDNNLS